MKIHVIGLGKTDMTEGWPHHNFDVAGAMKNYKKELERIGKANHIEFIGYDAPQTEGELMRLLDRFGEEKTDGVLAISLTAEFACLGPSIFKIADSDLPVVVYTKPFSTYWDGGGKLYAGDYRVEVCDSERIDDIVPILDIVRVVSRFRGTRLLLLKDYDYDTEHYDPRMAEPRWMGLSYFNRLKNVFGIETVRATTVEILKYYEKVDDAKAKKLAGGVEKSAKGVLGPSGDDLLKAAKLYLALKSMMKETGTNAVTAGCLNWIRHQKLPISPCLALSLLNDEGIPAGCEADVESLVTLCFCHYLAGRPGFQADPVIDESTNRVTLSHCTAATRLLGYDKKPFPFWIRPHTESWRDLCVETEMKQEKGEAVTILKLEGVMSSKNVCWPEVNVRNRFEGYSLLAYKAEAEDLDSDRSRVSDKERTCEWGCRTKLTVRFSEAGELENFKKNFYGHHRVALYGDWVKKLKMAAKFLGIGFVNKPYLRL
jgi:hypothetical protein